MKNRGNGKIVKMLRNYSIQRRLSVTIMCLILLTVMTMGGIPYVISRHAVLAEVRGSNEKYVVSLANSIAQNINQIEELLTQIQYSEDITTLATDETLSKQDIIALRKSISNNIKTLLTGKAYIAGINVYLKNNIVFPFGYAKVDPKQNYLESSWYETAQKGNGRISHISPGLDVDSKKITQNNIATGLIVSRRSAKPIGAVYSSIDPSYFGEGFNNNKSSEIFIMDKVGTLIYSNVLDNKKVQGTYINDIVSGLKQYYNLLPQDRKESVVTKTYTVGKGIEMTAATEKHLGYKVKGNIMVTYVPLQGNSDWMVVSLTPEQSFIGALSKIYWTILIVAVVMFVICILVSRILTRSISEPLKVISNFLKSLSQGDLTQDLRDSSKDEIGVLIKEASEMKVNVVRLLQEVKDASELINKVSGTIENSIAFNIEVSGQLSATLQGLAVGVSQTAENTEEMVNVMTKLGTNITVVDEMTETVSSMAVTSQELSHRGSEVVDKLTDSSLQIRYINEQITKDIDNLTITAKGIHLIVGVIEDIAEQTNLLALNAAIESARAGEVGKGFAVVAKEIRNLAERAKQSTNSIKGLLKNIDSQAQITTKTADKARKIVEMEVDSVKQTAETLSGITEAMISISDKIIQVKSSVSVIVSQKDQALSSLENTAAVAEETSVAVQEVSATSEEQEAVIMKLGETIQELNHTVHIINSSMQQFKF